MTTTAAMVSTHRVHLRHDVDDDHGGNGEHEAHDEAVGWVGPTHVQPAGATLIRCCMYIQQAQLK